MDLSSGGVAGLVFKQAIRGDLGKLSLDGQMLSVLMSFDGKKTLGQVAQQSGINLGAIRPIVARLIKYKLIEPVETQENVVDQDFMTFLISQLSVAIGPLGGIVVEDGLEDLGYTKTNFPTHRTAELVNLLSQEIQREDKRIQFKQVMLKKIKDKGY
ncbi:MAG: hypothetical protein QNJ17_07990 [Desulfocapsaceae bacterium]|nr:hypothetical protein [Desulfocapsaceae bacterium]